MKEGNADDSIPLLIFLNNDQLELHLISTAEKQSFYISTLLKRINNKHDTKTEQMI